MENSVAYQGYCICPARAAAFPLDVGLGGASGTFPLAPPISFSQYEITNGRVIHGLAERYRSKPSGLLIPGANFQNIITEAAS
jgi:hypothetical protein